LNFTTTMASKQASVVLVGCGRPLKSMGWYHSVQLLEERCPSAKLCYVVEPFFSCTAAKDVPGYNEFHAWKETVEKEHGVQFFEKVHHVPPLAIGEFRMGIISARTGDNPALFSSCLDIGCKTIFLEKPGAPTVKQLEEMKDSADKANVSVFMGFNKNVSSYLTRTLEYAEKAEVKCDVTFLHNNAYENTEEQLAECFERNAEGMLKNMVIHELALLATYYDVSVDNIESVEADPYFSSCKTLKGPTSGKDFTDFDKIKFKIKTKNGKEASIAADRCGGDDSLGIVTDETGRELARFTMPDFDAIANIPNLEKLYPGAQPYFFTQDPDYCTLKERVAKNCVDGTEAEGVASLDVAIASLKLAEYLTPILQEQLLKK
jgi:predicted dehydrogenase